MAYFVEQLGNGLSLGCIYALIALGFAMVYGVLKFLNFAHSEVFTAGTFIAYFTLRALIPRMGEWPLLVLCLTLAAAGAGAGVIALLLERVAYRPLRGGSPMTALLSAIGVSILLQNVGIHLFSAHTRGFPALNLPIGPRTFAVMMLAVSLVVLHTIVYRTDIGIRMRAVAEKAETAILMGIAPNRVIATVFFLGGMFAGVAGVVWGTVYGTVHPQMGFHPGLKAFVIAVVGSIGHVMGTFIIGIALGVIEALFNAYLPASVSGYRDTLVFGTLLVTLALRPQGIFGKPGPSKV